MATLTVCSRLNGKPKRFKLEGVNIDGKVSELKGRLSDEVKFSAHELGEENGQKTQEHSSVHLSTMLCPLLGHPPSQPPPPLQPPPPYQDGSRLSGLRYRDFLWINSQNEITNSSESFVDLLYCGQRLQDEKTLKEYSITTSSTIHILRRNFSDDDASAPEPLDQASVEQVVTALQNALINPAYRNVVENLLKNPESLENIIATSPGLDKDPVAQAILQDAELLAILADPSYINKVIEAHPSLSHAAMSIAAAVNEETASGSGLASQMSAGSYSLDQMSDDEDMDPVRPRATQSGSQITASQLAAAFAAVTTPQSSGQSSSQASTSQGSSQQPIISADFFSQALSQITGATSSSSEDAAAARPSSSRATAPQGPPEEVILRQLAQLRDMGISDEAAARQALMVTGGDLQAALDILFGGS